jgi:hypothetical protein
MRSSAAIASLPVNTRDRCSVVVWLCRDLDHRRGRAYALQGASAAELKEHRVPSPPIPTRCPRAGLSQRVAGLPTCALLAALALLVHGLARVECELDGLRCHGRQFRAGRCVRWHDYF